MDKLQKAAEEALKHAQDHGRGNSRRWKQLNCEEIRELRNRLKLTQREFASVFGFDLATIKSWETDRRHPDQAACLVLAMIQYNCEGVLELLKLVERKQAVEFRGSLVAEKHRKPAFAAQ